MKYTKKELDRAALADLRIDAEFAKRQAATGPYYPERGITRDSLLAYAAECRAKLRRYAGGGAHEALLKISEMYRRNKR